MKKLFLLLIGLVVFTAQLRADDMSASARRFKNSVKSFLTEEGYDVTESSSGMGLIFEMENHYYGITFLRDSPVLVRIISIIDDPECKNECDILKAINKMNYVCDAVKVTYDDEDDDIVIAMEAFYHSTEEFRYTFSKNMAEINAARRNYSKRISEVSGGSYSSSSSSSSASSPVVFMSAQVANTDADNGIINDYGSSIFAYRTRYLKPKLNLKVNRAGTYTFGVKLYQANGTLSTGGSSESGYTYTDTKTLSTGTREVTLSGWGQNVSGNWPAGDYRFEFYCDGKYIGSKSFTIK